MKISKGPMLEKYAKQFVVEIDEVVEWVNSYVNGPWPESLMPHLEQTESERLASIRGYIVGAVGR